MRKTGLNLRIALATATLFVGMSAMALTAAPAAAHQGQAQVRSRDQVEAARLEAEAIALRDAGDFAGSDRRIADLIPIELRLYGPDSPLLANSWAFRADLALARGDADAAAMHLAEEAAIRSRGGDVGGAASAALKRVEALTKAGRLADAEAQLTAVWPSFARDFDPDQEMARSAIDGLAMALSGEGRVDSARELVLRLSTDVGGDDLAREQWLQSAAERMTAAGRFPLGVGLLRHVVDRRVARGASPDWQAEAWGRLADAQGGAFEWADASRSRRAAVDLWGRAGNQAYRARENAYLGRALLEAGETAEAYQRLSEAWAAVDSSTAAEDRAYLAVHLARAALATGDVVLGDRLSVEAVDLRRQGPAADPMGLRLALEVRADVMVHGGRFDEAERLLGEAREIALANDPTGPTVSVIDSMLSEIRGTLGRNADAESLARASIEDVADRFGPRSPQMVVVLGNLATQLSNSGEFDRALPLARQAVDIQRDVAAGRSDGPEVRDLLNAEYKLGRILGGAGDHEESLDLLNDVHLRAGQALGRRDAIFIDSGVQAGYLLMQMGRTSDAEIQLRKMARLAEAARGADSHDLIDVLQLHSAALFGLGRYRECLAVMQRVMALTEAAAPRWPRTRIDVMTNTALTLARLDRTGEAIDLLRKAGDLALARNAQAGASGGGETSMSRQPFVVLVQVAWAGANGA